MPKTSPKKTHHRIPQNGFILVHGTRYASPTLYDYDDTVQVELTENGAVIRDLAGRLLCFAQKQS